MVSLFISRVTFIRCKCLLYIASSVADALSIVKFVGTE